MFRKLSEVPFEEWVARVFDRPITHPGWYHESRPEDEEDRSWETQEPATIVANLTRLFREAGLWLPSYSPQQLKQGLWFLADNACSSYMFALLSADVSSGERQLCIEAFSGLYAGLFEPHCAAVLAHRFPPRRDPLQEEEQRLHMEMAELYRKFFPEPPTVELPQKVMGERIRKWSAEREPLVKRLEAVQGSGIPWDPYPLNSVCYMWWDILPIAGAPEDPSRSEFDGAVLDVMERALELDSVACQESALHGLGHWRYCYPERVEAVVDAYLSRVTPEGALLDYARQARTGCIL